METKHSLKKVIFLFTFISCLIIWSNKKVVAQGNLQFNQVINADLQWTTYTVPANKVFKLEGVCFYDVGAAGTLRMGSWSGGSDYFKLKINNINYPIIGDPSAYNPQIWPFPLWFKAGTFITSLSDYPIYINGIEFNIIP